MAEDGLSTEQKASVLREISEGYAAISSLRETTMRRRAQMAQLAARPATAAAEAAAEAAAAAAALPFGEVARTRLPKVRTAAGYATLRALLRLHGVDRLRGELAALGLVGADGQLGTDTLPLDL